jgi:hypothetical protein
VIPLLWRCVLFLLLPWAALADGIVFPRGEFDPSQVPIPDQRAMIHWADGVERLVIETSFAGPGTNFAWVVPLPAVAEIEEATPGLFPTLTRIFLPAVDLEGDRWFVGFGWLAMGCWAVLRRDRLASKHQIWLTLAAFAWGMVWANHVLDFAVALLGTLLLLVVSADLRRRQDPTAKSDLMALILLSMTLLLVGGILLPALGPAGTRGIGSGDTAGNGVEVLARSKTESFEAEVVAGSNAAALTDWLRDRGYGASPEVVPVISNYVRQGWVFAATRLLGVEAGATNATPSISFRFASAEPVYPMALTGVGSHGLKVELFVFGPEQVSAPGWKAIRSQPLGLIEGIVWNPRIRPVPWLATGHPLLRKWIGPDTRGTLLRASLTPSEMRRDVRLEWAGTNSFGGVMPSSRYVGVRALNYGAWVAAIFAGVALALRRSASLGSAMRCWHLGWVAGGIMALLLWSTTSAVTVRSGAGPRRGLTVFHDLQRSASEMSRQLAGKQLSDIECSERFRRYFTTSVTNVFTGRLMREGDAPGDFTVHEDESGDSSVFWIDASGSEVRFF